MRGPFCNADDTKVTDSRLVSGGKEIRRRRECIVCSERFTTYEAAALLLPKIIKRDGRRVPFDESKLRLSLQKALEKRPVSVDKIESAFQNLLHVLRIPGEREVDSQFVGELVMNELRKLDQVAYVRFASVYRSFQDVNAFYEEIKKLEDKKDESKS